MKLVDVDPLIVKSNEAQIEGMDTYKGLGLAKEMLIRAKGINPSTDAVSREEALEAFKPRGISQDAWEESNLYKTINALPAVENWIPTEKDNPKTDGRYIVTARVFGAYDPDHKGPYTDEVGESVFRKGNWPMTFNYLPCKIIAWQPLPKPYKGVSE